jgi:hypothetical protein
VKSTAPPVPLPGCADGCDIGFWLGYEGYDVWRVVIPPAEAGVDEVCGVRGC